MGPLPCLQADEVKLTADFKFPEKVNEEAKEGDDNGRHSAMSPEEGEFELHYISIYLYIDIYIYTLICVWLPNVCESMS